MPIQNTENSKSEPVIKIKGGTALNGEVAISGAKNAALPLLFSTLLAEGYHEFHNVPQLKDIQTTITALQSLGLKVKREGSSLQIKNSGIKSGKPNPSSITGMRAGVLCLGPLLACLRSCEMPLPGGCSIGARPIDLHLKGLRALGAKVDIQDGFLTAVTDKGLKGTSFHFDFPTVGGTENLILAGVKAKGITILKNTAIEPEILDLINYLNLLGTKIKQTGLREITIEGVEKLQPKKPYTVIPDRIEAGTFLLAGAITSGEISVTKCRPDHLQTLLEALNKCGWEIVCDKDTMLLKHLKRRGHGIDIETAVYPGFPTDLQSQLIVLMTQLNGFSSLRETIFEKRFLSAGELEKMGAKIKVKDHKAAFITGPQKLKGAKVQARDLRGGAGLILGGLVAEGETVITHINHILRGYEDIHLKLCSLGASVEIGIL